VQIAHDFKRSINNGITAMQDRRRAATRMPS
jgi:hypothetical protein